MGKYGKFCMKNYCQLLTTDGRKCKICKKVVRQYKRICHNRRVSITKDNIVQKRLEMVNAIVRANLYDAAKFLVQLFHMTETKYSCTRSKVEKMLSIANLLYMVKSGEALFDEDICVNSCGTGYAQLVSYLPSDILTGTESEKNADIVGEMTLEYVENMINKVEGCPPIYIVNLDTLDSATKSILISVFVQFGNYNSLSLGKMLDEFKNEISEETDSIFQKKTVRVELVRRFFELNVEISNDIVKFICEEQDDQ